MTAKIINIKKKLPLCAVALILREFFVLNKGGALMISSNSTVCDLLELGGHDITPRERSSAAKVLSKVFACGTVFLAFYWMIQLFALEISTKDIVKSKISKFSVELHAPH